jgi:SAM-dependent methyltransferase
LRERSYADVGCGAGVPVSIFRARWPWTPAFIEGDIGEPHFIGIDFSPRAVWYADRYGAYDKVILAESDDIPLGDGEVDVSLSIENLEHLYPDEVVPAIEELARIARREVIITTPWPWDVINRPWLDDELSAAQADPEPLDAEEFHVLAGCVHKSTLLPAQMQAAGFRCTTMGRRGLPGRHPVYVARTRELRPEEIGTVLGLGRAQQVPEAGDFRKAYADLLQASLDLFDQMPRARPHWRAGRLVDRARQSLQ